MLFGTESALYTYRNNNTTTKETKMNNHKLVAKADRDEVMELPRLSFWLKLDKQDTENEQARQEFDAWMDGQIAEQRAFEAHIDSLIS